MGTLIPINKQFPLTSFSKANFRTGSINVLPVSRPTEKRFDGKTDIHADAELRFRLIDFLSNGRPKVLRYGHHNVLVSTHDTTEDPLRGGLLPLAHVGINYTEIGKLNFQNILKYNLMESVGMGNLTFGVNGEIIISDQPRVFGSVGNSQIIPMNIEL
jgi:hypothetical protein